MGQTPLELWAGFECTVNRVGDRHFDQLARSGHDARLSDLDLLVDLGVRTVRYPVLWERVERDGWAWSDERLARLRALGIRPIVGLLHHGSGPLGTSLLDPRFPARLAAFAAAVAERYPWVDAWTPVNEPLTTARFAALYGHWYPHARDDAAFAMALEHELRATVESMAAIRQAVPDARLVQTEDIGKTHATPRMAYQGEFDNERRWLTFDLLCGRPNGTAAHYGLDERWFAENPCPPDILGVNHYLSGERFLDERIDRYPEHERGGNGRHGYADVLAARVVGGGPEGPTGVLRDTWSRYALPIAVTEVHNGCTREEQLRWLAEVWAAAEGSRADGADVRAVTVWSLLGAYGWDTLATGGDRYEPGVYDVASGTPRPTALARMAAALARGDAYEHPALASPGWWRRPDRIWYSPVGRVRERAGVAGPPILITGGTGTLGRAFARSCEARGLAYRLTTRDELDAASEPSATDVVESVRPWAIVNAAGYVRVDDAEHEPELCLRDNRDAAAVLARVAAERRIPLVTFSSDLVFDGRTTVPYTEADEPCPLNTYGRSKAHAEQLVLEAHPRALVVRTSAFFGPFDDANFATRSLRSLAAGDRVAAADDTWVSPTYVPDLVEATLDLLIDDEAGIWHVANDGASTWAEFAIACASAAGLDHTAVDRVALRDLGLAAARPRYSVLASNRGCRLPSLADAIERYVAARRTVAAAHDRVFGDVA